MTETEVGQAPPDGAPFGSGGREHMRAVLKRGNAITDRSSWPGRLPTVRDASPNPACRRVPRSAIGLEMNL